MRPEVFFRRFHSGSLHTGQPILDILIQKKGACAGMFRGGGNWIIGFCGIALGSGILIAAIFPVGALLFLVAFLLIACGCACCRR